ncbi:MAG: hypothetical protein KDD37_04680 [Bdellovibrionales bacterium]|nr:hypothetical protein [Bdellovibrionales bacterium]
MRLLLLLLVCIPIFSNAHVGDTPSFANLDGIGTFGGDWPFPLGPESDLPENISGLYEVRESVDGAYFNISREINPDTLRMDSRMDLFDPCTFKPTASGDVYIRKNTLYTTLQYPETDKRVRVRLKSFEKSDTDSTEQLVLIILKSNSKDMEKYFPVEKIDIEDVIKKCKKPPGKP